MLSPAQRMAIESFARLPDQERFYLTGGAALSEFYLHHRLSRDLNFFTTEQGLIQPFCRTLEVHFHQEGWQVRTIRSLACFAEVQLQRPGETEVLRLDLALDSPFQLETQQLTSYQVLIPSYHDLVVNKLLAFFGRTEPRDAVDLFFILQRESLDPLLDMAARKDPGFDLYWFAAALHKTQAFPDEPQRWPVMMQVPFSPVELKRTFLDIARSLMQRILSPPPGPKPHNPGQ
jgi:hypothetical protein